jgi:Ino eighty subunit 2
VLSGHDASQNSRQTQTDLVLFQRFLIPAETTPASRRSSHRHVPKQYAAPPPLAAILSLTLSHAASSSKLRQSTSAASRRAPARGTRNRKPMVEVDTDEDLEAEEEEEEDAEGDEDVDMEDADGDEDAELDADGDDDVDTPPVQAVSRARASVRGGRKQAPSVMVTPADEVEAKEVRRNIHPPNDDDDEELSDVDDEEDAEGEEDMDADGDEDEIVRVGAEDDDDSDLDSDDDTPASGSRALTPDLSKLTKRQRAAYEEKDGVYMSLSNGTTKPVSPASLIPAC